MSKCGVFFWSVFSGIRTESGDLLRKKLRIWTLFTQSKPLWAGRYFERYFCTIMIIIIIIIIIILLLLELVLLQIRLVLFFWVRRSSHRRCSIKKGLKNFARFTGRHLCWSLFLIKLQAWGPEVISGEYYDIWKNTYFEEHLRTIASEEYIFFPSLPCKLLFLFNGLLKAKN